MQLLKAAPLPLPFLRASCVSGVVLRIGHLFTEDSSEASKSLLLRWGNWVTVKCNSPCISTRVWIWTQTLFCYYHWFITTTQLALSAFLFSHNIDMQRFYFSMCLAVAMNCGTIPWACMLECFIYTLFMHLRLYIFYLFACFVANIGTMGSEDVS